MGRTAPGTTGTCNRNDLEANRRVLAHEYLKSPRCPALATPMNQERLKEILADAAALKSSLETIWKGLD